MDFLKKNFQVNIAIGFAVVFLCFNLVFWFSEVVFEPVYYQPDTVFSIDVEKNAYDFKSEYITEDMYKKIVSIPIVRDAAIMNTSYQKVIYNDFPYDVEVKGITGSYYRFEDFELDSGRLINKYDEIDKAKYVIITEELAYEIFNSKHVIGETVEINSNDFTIIGIRKDIPTLLVPFAKNKNYEVYMPITTMKTINGGDLNAEKLMVAANNSSNMKQLKIQIEGLIDKKYNAKKFKTNEYGNMKLQLVQPAVWGIFFYILYVFIKALVKKGNEYKNTYYKTIFVTLMFVLGIIIIYLLFASSLYVKEEYIPKQLIDLKAYKDILKDKFKEFNQAESVYRFGILNMKNQIFKMNLLIIIVGLLLGNAQISKGVRRIRNTKGFSPAFLTNSCMLGFACGAAIIFIVFALSKIYCQPNFYILLAPFLQVAVDFSTELESMFVRNKFMNADT